MPIDKHHAFGLGTTAPLQPTSKTGWRRTLKNVLLQKLTQSIDQYQIEQATKNFMHNAHIELNCRIGPRAWCVNPAGIDHIQLGQSVICRGVLRCEDYSPGNIIIHHDVYISDDVIISCANKIEIGAYTLLAHGVQVFDNDSHPIAPDLRVLDYLTILGRNPGPRQLIPSAPIFIGERCWIGINVLILKGVSIGNGSVIAAGSVVTADVPQYTLAAGNPARVVKTLAQSKEIFSEII